MIKSGTFLDQDEHATDRSTERNELSGDAMDVHLPTGSVDFRVSGRAVTNSFYGQKLYNFSKKLKKNRA